MIRSFLAIICFFCTIGTLEAQNSRNVRNLQNQKKEVQKKLEKAQSALSVNKAEVGEKLLDINIIADRIENRKRYIDDMEKQLLKVENRISDIQKQIEETEASLESKKNDYVKALRFQRSHQVVKSPLLFILSANTVRQMYRRSRYAREYSSYQRMLAEQIVDKKNELLKKKSEQLKAKDEKNTLIAECRKQRELLEKQHQEEQKNVASLKERQRKLAQDVEKQKKQLLALDRRIDEMIAWEMEQARKRREEERRKAAKKKSSSKSKTQEKSSAKKSEKKSSGAWLTPRELSLNGSFEKNKGRLPVPITGKYMLGSRFGTYNVPGLKNVKLDNKGTNYIGVAGARARAIFDGEVTAVFQFGTTKNVLIRHGSYISVYCNLSSVIVHNGQRVKTRDIIGTVDTDNKGNSILHFQLRKETTKLNPEIWICK